MSEDVKARIIIPIAEPLRNLKELQKGFEGVGDKAIIAGAGAGNLGTALKGLAPAAGIAAAGVAVVATASIAAAGGLFKLSESVALTGDELAKAARRQGGSVEFLSALNHAASLAGVGFGDLENGIRNFNRSVSEVLTGDLTERGKALQSLGVAVKDSAGQFRGYEEILLDTADAFGKIDNDALKVEAAFTIFGRAGTQLIPLLDEGREGIEAYLEEARRLGNVYDEDLALASEAFMDSQDRVRASVQGVKNTIARELLPVFTDILEGTADWVSANRELLAQDIKAFLETIISVGTNAVEVLKPIAGAVFDISTAVLKGFNTLAAAPTHFGTFRVETDSTRAAVDLLAGSYGPFIDSVKISEGVYRDASNTANQLAGAMGNLSTETHSVATAMAGAKGPVDEFFSSALNWIKQINSTPVVFGFTPIAQIQEQRAAVVNLTTQASKMGGVFSGEVEPSLKKTGLAIGDTTTKYRLFGSEQDAVATSLENVEGLGENWEERIVSLGGSTDDAKKKGQDFNDTLKSQIDQLQMQIDTFGLTERELVEYNRVLHIAKGGSVELANAVAGLSLEFLDLKDAIEGVEEFLAEAEKTEKDFVEQQRKLIEDFNSIEIQFLPEPERIRREGEALLAQLETIANQRPQLEKKAHELSLRVAQEYTKRIAEAERAAYIERLKLSDSFFDNLKGGYLEFAYAVETNGELVSQFFANTLTSMSQSFSDLFYNVLTGRFDDLKDLAKQTFEAILRAFLDMVSAIATRQIVISIAGAFGVNTQGFAAEDVLGFGTQAVDAFGGGGSAAPSPAPYNPGEAVDVGGQIYTQGPDGTMVPMDANGAPQAPSQIGQGIGAGILGISIGSAIGGMINSDMSGFEQGISLGLGAAGAVGGFLIAGPIGAAVGGFIGSLIVPIFSSIFKKTPRLDIDFDSIKTDLGRRAATIEELLDDDFFADNIGQVSVKRKAGLGVGGDEKILELIQDRIEDTIEGIQDIIGRLPSDMFEILNQTLLDAELDIDTVIGGERLLEFDAKGKKIGEKFQAFIEGELPAKVFAGIRESFFDPAFQALGVSADATQDMIDQFLADMEAAGSREARAAVGQEFIEKFSAFVDAFNIVEGNFGDSIGQTINSVETLSRELGFNAVPSIDEMTEALKVMIENGEIDPEVIQGFVDLRTQLIQVKSALTDTISGLVDFINQLNTKIVGLGGSAVDVGYAIDEAIASIMETLSQEGLSLEEREALLRQLDGLVDQWVEGQTAAQQAVAQEQQAAAQAEAKARQEAITGQISALEREKQMIAEVGQERLAALNEELQVTQNLFSIAENIGKNIQDLLLGSSGVESPFQRLQRAQSDLDSLQTRFASSTGEERGALAQDIQELLNTVLDIGGEAFDNTSPEFRDTFRQVINELGSLKDQVEPTKSIEQINQEIADLTKVNEANLRSIDDRMEALRAQAQAAAQEAAAIGQQAFQLDEETAAEARAYYEYIQQEAQANLDARLAQLAELGIDTNGALSAGEAIAAEQLVTLRDIHAALVSGLEGNGQTNIANVVNPTTGTVETSSGPVNYNPFSPFSVIPAATGFEGIVKKAQLFLAGEAGEEHVSITPVKDLAERARANQSHISDLVDSITSGMGNTINDFAEEVLSSQTRISDFADRVLGSQTHISDMVDRLGGHIDVVPGMNLSLSVDLRGSTFDSAERVSEVEGVLDRFGQKLERRIKDSVFKDMRHDMRTRRYLKLK